MRKRVHIALAVVLVMLVGVSAWLALRLPEREREPVYQGKRASAQFVEVSAHITVTDWRTPATGPTIETHWGFSARCLLGTNCWLIEDNASRNSRHCWWFTGSNVVMHGVITKEPLAQDFRDARDWLLVNLLGRTPPPARLILGKLPHRGTMLNRVVPSSDGRPPLTMQPLAWLAFCSGAFLTSAGREIPPPLYHFRDGGISDKTSTYAEVCGLPQRVEFYTSDDHLVCCYEVQQSTNLWGRTFPLEFTVTHYAEDTWKPRARAVGKVTAIRQADRFEVPAEVRTALGR